MFSVHEVCHFFCCVGYSTSIQMCLKQKKIRYINFAILQLKQKGIIDNYEMPSDGKGFFIMYLDSVSKVVPCFRDFSSTSPSSCPSTQKNPSFHAPISRLGGAGEI